MPDYGLVRATILAATAFWAWAEVLKRRRPGQTEPARRLWTAGVACAWIHAGLAFEMAYGWSHERAVAETARQTAAVTGLDWGGGIVVNYAFLVLWLADAAWWWRAPFTYLARPRGVELARLAFFVFMFVNGAIVFAGPAGRLVGVPAVAAVCAAWLRGARGRNTSLTRPARRS